MAGDNAADKIMVGKAAAAPTGGRTPAAAGGGRIARFFNDVRAIFTKFSGKDKKPAGIVTPAAQRKPPLTKVLEAFSLQKLDLKFINQILIGILASLTLLLFYVTFRERPSVTSVKAAVSKINFGEAEPPPLTLFQELDFYLGQAEARDIFNVFVEKQEPVVVAPVEPAEPVEPPPPPEPPKVPIEDKARGLKLIGISWGNDPKAIIQDDKTQEVHFVAVGETVPDREVDVREIKKGEVILGSDEDTMSLM